MNALHKHISERLKTHKSCTIFENKIASVWPVPGKEHAARVAAIHQFAKEHGWIATINNPGIRVTFKKSDASVT